ncbi:MAG: hypothetical protein MJ252_00770 [archaeon]|nr:hypothetical protein [archaeon]
MILFFALIAIIPLLFVFVYFIVRFVFKKCKGPAKIREISKCYRYNTWILMGFASAAVLGLMITITVFSQKSR